MYKQEIAIELHTINCAYCGCLFAVTEGHHTRLLADGSTFYCPNGHNNYFRDSLESRLKKAEAEIAKERTAAKQLRGWYEAEQKDHEHTRKRLAAQKGVLTRTKNRVANGVCPCCNRTFANLARHMAGQHPEYAREDAGA